MARKKRNSPVQRRIPIQGRAHFTVSLILETAAIILRADGRAGFTTNKLAERAGISIGTLYGYFPNKDAIYIALARQLVDQDATALTAVLNEGHAAETLRHLLRTLFKRHHEDRYVRRTVMSIYIAEGFGAEHERHVEAMINALIARPELLDGREIPPISAARLFAVSRAILGIARAFVEQGDVGRFSLKQVEDEAIELIRAYVFQ